jgi:hypothetical protein
MRAAWDSSFGSSPQNWNSARGSLRSAPPDVASRTIATFEPLLLYTGVADPDRAVICFDETPTKLIGETRAPIPARPGEPDMPGQTQNLINARHG